MDWRVFDKLQDDDLVSALARRQADEEGRLAILRAQEQMQATRTNQEIARDNAETNRAYREASIEERRASTQAREEAARLGSQKERAEAERMSREEQESLAILNDPNAPEEMKAQVRARRAGLTVAPFKVGGQMVPTFVRRRDGSLAKGEMIPEDAKILPETTPAPNFTIVNTPEGQRPYDRRNNRLLDPIADLAPTAQMRERDRAHQAILPIFGKLDELSQRINTSEGIYATAVGTVKEQAAKVNLDNDVAEYKRILTAMIPMAARAFGHTGVLTQLDVESAMAAFAQPTDSKAMRDRLTATVRDLMQKINAARYASDAMRAAESGGQKTGAAIGAAADSVRTTPAAPKRPRFNPQTNQVEFQ